MKRGTRSPYSYRLAVAADLSRPGQIERVMEQVRTELTAKQSPTTPTKVLSITADVTEVFIYLASNESKHLHGQRFEAHSEVEVNSNSRVTSLVD